MFCTKCGAKLPENAKFCSACGTVMGVAAPVVPVVEAPVVPVEETPVVPAVEETPVIPAVEETPVVPAVEETPVVPAVEETPVVPAVEETPVVPVEETPVIPAAPQKNKKPLLILVAILAAVAVAAGCLLLFCGNTFQSILDDNVAAVLEGDLSNIEALAPPQAWDKLAKETGVSVSQLSEGTQYAAAVTEFVNQQRKQFISEFGMDYSIEYVVLCDHEVSEKDKERVLERLEEYYDIQSAQVDDVRLVHAEARLEGSENMDYSLDDFTAVKIEGDWYLMSGSSFLAFETVQGIVR